MAKPLVALLVSFAAAVIQANPTEIPETLDESIDPINLSDYTHLDLYAESNQTIARGKGTRIVGGRQAARNQFPWQAALFIDGRSFCGGSLISSTIVITAAHCTSGARSINVYLGAHDLSLSSELGRQIFQSTSIFTHPQYNPSTINNDIAVVRLPRPAIFTSSVMQIWIYDRADVTFQNVRARASGWGKTYDASTSISAVLNYVDLNVISNAECARSYGSIITDTKMCVSTASGSSTCQGDSGGPLVYEESPGNWKLIGLTSFGSAQGCSLGHPAAFTRVASYADNFLAQFI